MNTIEKATPRPWSINKDTDEEVDKNIWISSDDFPNICATDNDDMPEGAGMANAKLIVKSVNEYGALNAVAMAAMRLIEQSKSNFPHRSYSLTYDTRGISAIQAATNDFLDSINALSTLRAKEGK